MSFALVIHSNSAAETVDIGRILAGALAAGDVVALCGGLGSGKTQLAKGVALGAGVPDDRIVSSPTFVIHHRYDGRVAVHHLDAYRVAGPAEFEGIGFEEICRSGGAVIVEWADRVAAAIPPGALWIELAVTGPDSRRLSLRTDSDRVGRRLDSAGLDRFAHAVDKT